MRSVLLRPITKTFLAVLGLAWIVFLLFRHRTDLESLASFDTGALVLLLILMISTNAAAAFAWATLMAEKSSYQFVAYLSSVPARYLPGGIGQPISQAANAARAVGDIPRVGVRMVQHFLISIGTAGVLVLLGSFFAPVSRFSLVGATVCAVSGFVVSSRPVVYRVWRIVFRRRTPIEPAPFLQVLKAAIWTAVGLVTMAAGYWLALEEARGPFLAVAIGFLLAWITGYVTLLVPGGLGVRESALLVFVPGPTGALVAGSVMLRIVGLLADLLVGIGGKLGLSRTRSVKNQQEPNQTSRIARGP